MGAIPPLRLRRPSSRTARHDVAATVVSSPVPASVPDIIQFVRDPQLLGLSLSPAQETLLRAIYGLPLTPPQRELWHLCTGRESYPAQPFSEVTILAGARVAGRRRVEYRGDVGQRTLDQLLPVNPAFSPGVEHARGRAGRALNARRSPNGPAHP